MPNFVIELTEKNGYNLDNSIILLIFVLWKPVYTHHLINNMAGADEVIKVRTIPMYSTTGDSNPVGVIIIKTVKRWEYTQHLDTK